MNSIVQSILFAQGDTQIKVWGKWFLLKEEGMKALCRECSFLQEGGRLILVSNSGSCLQCTYLLGVGGKCLDLSLHDLGA